MEDFLHDDSDHYYSGIFGSRDSLCSKQNNDSSFCEKISIMINRRWSKTLI